MELNIFIDESGYYMKKDDSDLYIVSFVMHESNVDISNFVYSFENKVKKVGIDNTIHIANVVKNTNESKMFVDLDERRSYFKFLEIQLSKMDIKCNSVIVDKKKYKKDDDIINATIEGIEKFLSDNDSKFKKYKKINVYYDNGQSELKGILRTTFRQYQPNFPEYKVNKKILHTLADFVTFIDKLIYKHKTKYYKITNSELNFLEKNKKRYEFDKKNKYFIKLMKNKA